MPNSPSLPARAAPLALLALVSCSMDGTADVPGDVHRFDPIAAYPAVAAAAGPKARMVKLEAHYVRENGTQDLEASYVGFGDVDQYTLLRPNGARDDPSVPVGARKT